MHRVAVVYTSRYGSTEKYARWIAEAAGGDVFRQEDCRGKLLADYEVIVYGGPVHAGGILGLDWLKKNLSRLSGKKLFVFAVGLNVESEETQRECREINFVKKLKGLPCWFFPGAYDPKQVSGMDRRLMAVVKKMLLSGKGEKTPEQEMLLEAIEKGADYTDRKAVSGLTEAIGAALEGRKAADTDRS